MGLVEGGGGGKKKKENGPIAGVKEGGVIRGQW